MKLIVLNSVGPMATSLVASIIEKYGYINLPIRKRQIHQYLLKKNNLNDNIFKELTIQKLKNLSKLMNTGGVSVVDRDSLKKISRINIDLISKDLKEFYEKKFSTFEEMYFESMLIANKGTIYKEKINHIKGSIEITTDIIKYDPNEILKAYKNNFKEVQFIFLQRPFPQWLNALCAQSFVRKYFNYMDYIKILTSRKRHYDNYDKFVSKMPGLKINFDELFLPNNSKIFFRIKDFLNEKNLINDKENINYDLFGRIADYKKAFTKYDDNIKFLSKFSMYLAEKVASGNYKSKFIINLLFLISHFIDIIKYKLFRKKILKIK